MSYLNTLRLHFAGRFFSNPSTVNNHPAHYDNAAFNRTKHWKSGRGGSPDHGWWNPEGAHAFRLENTVVTAAIYEDGMPASVASDQIMRLRVESRGRNPAKMVDLDPDQQLVSMIFGLDVALVDDQGRTMLQGSFEPAPFTDIWRKGPPPGGDEAASVAYQSVLNGLTWGDLAQSTFLQQMRQQATDGLLSIKFNLDGYSMDSSNAARFAKGRIVGTIGCATLSEPKHWVVGRHFGSEVHPTGSANPGFVTQSGVNYCVGVHDKARGRVRIDLGNALPVAPSGGPFQDIGMLLLGCRKPDGSVIEIGEIHYRNSAGLENAAGVAEVPQDRSLTDTERDNVERLPLCLVKRSAGADTIVSEEPTAHVRADLFVARLNAGGRATIALHASRLGQPLANARVELFLFAPPGADAQANFPVAGLEMPSSIDADGSGIAELTVLAHDPGSIRFFYDRTGSRRVHVDGQVYRIGYQLEGVDQSNPSNFLSILVWNNFVSDDPPTWHGSMRRVCEQYGNLYPWMTKFGPRLDLADYAQVADAREDIIEVLSLADTHAHYMPVTRDLSEMRRKALLRWLTEVGADGRPLLGTAPAAMAAAAPTTSAVAAPAPVQPERGSKTFAGERVKMVRYNLVNR